MDGLIHLLKELGYPATSIALLILGAYILHHFFTTHLTTVVNRDLEELRQRNSEYLENLRSANSARLASEIEDLRQRNSEQLEAAKKDYALAIENRRAELTATAGELEYVRQHYAGIKEYSSAEAEALREAFLVLFEPENSRLSANVGSPDERLNSAIENVLGPLRRHLGLVDELTAKKIYAVGNYLRNFKGRETELTKNKITFWEITERAKRFVKADRIAYRLGLVNRILEEIKMVKVRVLDDGIPLLGHYTNPQKGHQVEISEDEWMSEDVQGFVREKKIEKIQSADDRQPS
jgi:hypothetical protein